MPPRTAILFHRFGPYHCARLNATRGVLPVLAVELSSETSEYAWNRIEEKLACERVTLFMDGDSRQASPRELKQRLRVVLETYRPATVAVPGWSERGSLAALGWCADQRVPAIVLSDTTAWDSPRRWWKEWVKRQILKFCSAALVGGAPHVEYLTRLGMSRATIFTGYDAVDNEYFRRSAIAARNREAELRNRHGLPSRYFLASARFIEKKNLRRLLEAYARYRTRLAGADAKGPPVAQPWDLVLLGDGPLKPELGSLIGQLHLSQSVHLPGFKQYADLPVYYALAQAFVHASTTEQWGLVVNEAMASGLPVLVSHRCGCATDLVCDGVNGFTFDPLNLEQMAGLMHTLTLMAPAERLGMGDSSTERIAHWGPDRFATGLSAAVEQALQASRPSSGLVPRLALFALRHR